jgi:hypothetical protein
VGIAAAIRNPLAVLPMRVPCENVPLTVEKKKAIPPTIITRSSGFRQVPFQEKDGPTL